MLFVHFFLAAGATPASARIGFHVACVFSVPPYLGVRFIIANDVAIVPLALQEKDGKVTIHAANIGDR